MWWITDILLGDEIQSIMDHEFYAELSVFLFSLLYTYIFAQIVMISLDEYIFFNPYHYYTICSQIF